MKVLEKYKINSNKMKNKLEDLNKKEIKIMRKDKCNKKGKKIKNRNNKETVMYNYKKSKNKSSKEKMNDYYFI